MTSLIATNEESRSVIVKNNGEFITLDTETKDVISVSNTCSIRAIDGWVKANSSEFSVIPDWVLELANAATTSLDIDSKETSPADKVFRVPKSVQRSTKEFSFSTATLEQIHEFAESGVEASKETSIWVDRVLEGHPLSQSLTASVFVPDDSDEYFGVLYDDDFSYTGLIALHEDGSWEQRVSGGWESVEEPDVDDIVLLGQDTAKEIADWVDTPVEDRGSDDTHIDLSTIDPVEFGIFNAAAAELDMELLDRVFDVYDSYERSINAQKQVRGPGGRFGGGGGSSKEPATADNPKARLAASLPLVESPGARIDEYLSQVAQERENNPVTAAATGDSVPTSDVRPLYFAVVDDVDTDAVLDVISIVPPAAGQEGAPTAWRRDAGKWVAANEMIAALKGSSPPPVVELVDDTILKGVLEQVDKSTANKDVEGAETPGATEVSPEGEVVEAPDPNAQPRPVTAAGDYDYKCTYCDRPATSRTLWADGRAQIRTCQDHESDARSTVEDDNNDEVVSVDQLDEDGNVAELANGGDWSESSRDKAAKAGEAMKDGSYPIKDKADLKRAIQAYGRSKNKAATKRHIIKRAKALKATDILPEDWTSQNATSLQIAQGFAFSDGSLLILDSEDLKESVAQVDSTAKQMHVTKRARALNRLDLIPQNWNKEFSVTVDLWGPYGELLPVTAAGGADRNRGNAETLRRYWTTGPGGAKIRWRTSGDFTRCVRQLTKYLGVRSRGYCSLRHFEQNGYYPGDKRNK